MEATLSATPSRRDYSLIGRDSKLAVENGLAAAEWYHTDIPRKADEGADAALRRAGDPRHRRSGSPR